MIDLERVGAIRLSCLDSVGKSLIDDHIKTFLKMNAEKKNLNGELYNEVRTGKKIPDVPLIVFTAMGTDSVTSLVTSQSFLREITEPINHMKHDL